MVWQVTGCLVVATSSLGCRSWVFSRTTWMMDRALQSRTGKIVRHGMNLSLQWKALLATIRLMALQALAQSSKFVPR